ncbi:hypothetical protein M422DRAFT_255507 [Sphaerobolus stellatus SS14]|uniref:Unplaced genomic scaffold SPHSTscaffold_61, whole genome shotgun sequence n=1 Tax=Sphaerobolus stellatus (strain SS14) TaxID=990650 RepID=A0A0C9VJ37_SPHS4|nr:hypothetical protein M422DRAFT_255507 [Sphaerobolus stellatus SS14]
MYRQTCVEHGGDRRIPMKIKLVKNRRALVQELRASNHPSNFTLINFLHTPWPLSLLLKSELLGNLSLYNIRGAPGVATGVGPSTLEVSIAGWFGTLESVRSPSVSRSHTSSTSHRPSIVCDLASAISRNIPKAHILVILNPINSSVPIVARTPEKRAPTILPASSASPPLTLSAPPASSSASPAPTPRRPPYHCHRRATLVHKIQYGGDEVRMRCRRRLLLRALKGKVGIVTPIFVKSPLFAAQGIEFFSSVVELGPNGVATIHDLGNITAQEQELVNAALFKKNIEKGFAFVQ